jgi:hypothetical protein
MSVVLWFNSLADILTPQYLTVLFLAVLLFSSPLLWRNYKQIKNSTLKGQALYHLRRLIWWEIIGFILLVLILLYNYPRL